MKKISQKTKSFFGLLAKTNQQFIPKSQKKTVILILVLIAISSQWWLVGSWVFGELINSLSNQPHVLAGISLVTLILINVIVDFTFRTISYLKNVMAQKAYTTVNNRVQKVYWNSYSKYDLQDRDSPKMQDAISNAQNNQGAISDIMQTEIDFIHNAITLIVAMVALSTIVWWSIPVLLVAVVPRLYFIWKKKNQQYKNEKGRQEIGRYRSALSSFMSTKDAKINIAQGNILSLFDSLRLKMNNVLLKNNVHFIKINWINDILFFVAEGAILLYLTNKVSLGYESVGIIFIFFTAFNRLSDSLVAISEKLVTLGITIKKAEDFYLIVEGTPAIVDDLNAQEVNDTVAPLIEFRNVWFKYPETEEWLLKDCSFSIGPSERVGLVAKNGEGKTTIALLLLRFYDVQQGCVLINGIDIRLIKRDTLLAITGVLFQDFKLLEGSVKFALAAFNFKESFSDHKLWDSLDKVGMKDYVKKLKNGLNHKISKIFKDSRKLSGGQSQKVGLAGVVCKEPRLLVLDEFTSALDPEAESEIIKQYEEISKGKTCLIISHRFNTLDMVDKIIILQGGCIVETGTKKELLSVDTGIFKSLFTASRLVQNYSHS